MRQVDSISLTTVHEVTEASEAQREVVLDGERTGIIVYGHFLNAAIQVDDSRYVLFVTHDCMFEETLTIALIDIREGIKEEFWLGILYAGGFFKDLSVSEDSIKFKFISDDCWTLKVSRTPTWGLPSSVAEIFPFCSLALGFVHREKFLLKKYMTITSPGEKIKLRSFFGLIGILSATALIVWAGVYFWR